MNNVDKRFTVFSDLPGMDAPGGGTIPPALCVTKINQTLSFKTHIYDLTMPLTRNIDTRHQEKTTKYTSFLTDITGTSAN